MQAEQTVNATSVKPSVERTAASADYNWRVMFSNAFIITKREVIDSFRDWRILAPILILTFIFPFLATFLANRFLISLRSTVLISRYRGAFCTVYVHDRRLFPDLDFAGDRAGNVCR